ncbi:MAG: hypothetical protein GY866_11880 [Proteobacteria bacterium]|nr:hypothetical protein [Pseudomonadota bacterium]
MESKQSKMQAVRTGLSAPFWFLCFEAAAAGFQAQKLISGVKTVDTFLNGGIPCGSVAEFVFEVISRGNVTSVFQDSDGHGYQHGIFG